MNLRSTGRCARTAPGRRLGRLVCAIAMSGAAVSAAAPAELRIDPAAINLNEQAVLTFILREARDLPPPAIRVPGLRIEYRGTSSQFSMVNGNVDRFKQHQYLVWADRAGEYEIGPFEYEHEGVQIEIPGVRLRVASGGAGGGDDLADRLRARLAVARPSLYVMEEFIIELAVYSQGLALDPNIQLVGWPEGGFRIEAWEELAGGREMVDGQVWEVRRFRGRARAETPGAMDIRPSLRVQILMPASGRRSDDPFGMMGGDVFAGTPFDRTPRRPYELAVEPLALDIRPLPEEGRPAAFSGAVGEGFRLDAEVHPAEVETGTPVTIRIEVAGRGSLEGIRPPSGDFGGEFRVYDPRPVPGETGPNRRVYEMVVIPREEGIAAVPAIEFAYFNPVSERYEILRKGPFPIRVTPSTAPAGSTQQAVGVFPSPEPPRGSDILYLKLAPAPPGPAARWAALGARLRGLAAAAPPLLAAAVWAGAVWRRRRARDVAGQRRRRAPRVARAALERARRAARERNAPGFYDALAGAISAYAAHRLDLPPGDCTGDRLLRALESLRLPERDLRRIGALWRDCEGARYGGLSAEPAFDVKLAEAEDLLAHLDRWTPPRGGAAS